MKFEYVPRGGESVTLNSAIQRCSRLRPEEFSPVRSIPHFRQQRSRPGMQYMKSTGGLVRYESLLEAHHLLEMDFNTSVIAVSSQPFRIHFGGRKKPCSHVPDFFCRLDCGAGEVVDVKDERHIDEDRTQEQFDLTAAFCEEVGWRYRVATDPPPARLANFRWLGGFRGASPFKDHVAPNTLDIAAEGIQLGELVLLVARRADIHQAVVRSCVFALMWDQQLLVDLDEPLTNETLVFSGRG